MSSPTSPGLNHGLLRGRDRGLTVFDKKFLLCAERGDVVSVKK